MGRVIYAQPHGQDDVDAGYGVDGDLPEVEHPDEVHLEKRVQCAI